MRNKRGQGLPLNVIILTVLGLLVLIVIAVLLIGRTSRFSEGVGQQEEAAAERICESPGTGRICRSQLTVDEQAQYRQVPGNWIDCTGADKCWEKIS